jgi:hypothetical protein
MAADATTGLIMHILLSVKQGANQFPNIPYVQSTNYATIAALPDDAPFGRGLFKKIDKASYEQAQKNLTAGSIDDLNDDARVLTRSVERLTATGGDDTPWDGPAPHPSGPELAAWVNALKKA